MIVEVQEFATSGRYADYFTDEMIDMGAISPELARIVCRRKDLGRERIGVSHQFLEDAETYHRKYFKPHYFKSLIEQALCRAGFAEQRPRILDLGAGSGNSVIAALELLDPRLVVAVDISPQLLAILRDYLDRWEGLRADCALVCMDACENAYQPNRFDLALGAAFLHHMPDPQRALSAIHTALRPGGHAIFFEPFENGHAVLSLAYQEIMGRVGRLRPMDKSVCKTLCRIIRQIETVRDATPEVRNSLDDKWVFTRGWLEELRQTAGFQRLTVYPIQVADDPFSHQTRSLLRVALGATPDALPRWAWDILRRYDTAFSEHLKRELLTEGAIILTK